MSARLRVAVAGSAWQVLRSVGEPVVSAPLAVMAALFVAVDAAWRAGPDVQTTLASTWGWWALVWVAVADGAVSTLRGLPWTQRSDGRFERLPLDLGRSGRLALRGGWLLAALGLLASTAARDRMVFRVAEGERFVAVPEQLVSRDPPHPWARGPFPVELTVERAAGGWSGDPRVIRAEGASAAGGRESLSGWPTWFGWGRWLRVIGGGVALQAEIRSEGGALFEGTIAKVDLERGRSDLLRFERVPVRVAVALAPGVPLAPGAPPALRATVFRGKLVVAEGLAEGGEPISFEGLRLAFPRWRPWVQIEMVRDPGMPLAALGLALGGAGAVVTLAGWRRERRQPAPGARPGGDA